MANIYVSCTVPSSFTASSSWKSCHTRILSLPNSSITFSKPISSSLSVKALASDFSSSFFEGGFSGLDDDPPSSSSSSGLGLAVEDKPEPQCPPGLRQYETMVVLRPDMTEDERLSLTQKYEELLIAGGAMYVEVFNRGVIPLAYSINKKNKAGEKNTYLDGIYLLFTYFTKPESMTDLEETLQADDDVIRSSSFKIHTNSSQVTFHFMSMEPKLDHATVTVLLGAEMHQRRAANNAASQNPRMQLSATTSRHHSAWNTNVVIKGELKEKLQVIQFDEKVKARDSLCCVCLGEFEMEEELQQVRLCRHVFHGDCIYQWLRANTTCPLCRCPLLSPPINSLHLIPANTTIHQVLQNNQQDQGGRTQSSSDGSVQHVIHISEEPSSSNTSSASCCL
ncbi:hypothetical protein KSS87_000018 [Heliosperma pusillum]|nr:hypothetical protein KSS87_000018 [Heliosperma pusillum]